MGETVVLDFPFLGGLDQKTAEQYLDPNKNQVSITNGSFYKEGAIDKRLGLASLSNEVVSGTLPNPTTGVRLASWSRSSLQLLSQGAIYNYTPAEEGLSSVGQLPLVKTVRRPINTSQSQFLPFLMDFSYNDRTLRMTIFYDQYGNISSTVYDADSGDIIQEATTVYSPLSGHQARIIQPFYLPQASTPSSQQVLVIEDFNTSTNTGSLIAFNYNPESNKFINQTTIATGLVGSSDLSTYVGDPLSGFVVAYGTSTTTIALVSYDQNFVMQTEQTITIPSGVLSYPIQVVATYGSQEHIWVSFVTVASGVYSYWLEEFSGVSSSGAFTSLSGPTSQWTPSTTQYYLSGMVRLSSSTVFLTRWCQQSPGIGFLGYSAAQGQWWKASGSSSILNGTIPLGFLPAAKPFCIGQNVYQTMYLDFFISSESSSSYTQSGQITLYLMEYNLSDISLPNLVYPISTVAPRQVNVSEFLVQLFYTLAHLPYMSNTNNSSTRYAIGFKINTLDTSASSGSQYTTWTAEFFFDNQNLQSLYQNSELGTELHIAASVPFVCDSSTTFEDNFFYYPEFTYSVLGGTGITIDPGSYTYAVVYCYTDGAGLVHRGAPVFTTPLTVPGNGTTGCILHITPLSVSWRDISQPGSVYAYIYRTLANGSTFYFIDTIQVSGLSPNILEVIWPANGSADSTPNSELSTASLLYTTGGVLDQINPPSSSIQIVYQDRVASVDDTYRNVWFTQPYTEGYAPGYNESLIIPFPDGGDITALAGMDSNFICFKNSSIFVMSGQGPAQTGQGSNWSVPQSLSTDVGCVSWQSVVNTPVGVLFQASSGIHLLGRDLQVTFVGRNVVDITNTYSQFLSSVLVPGNQQVKWVCKAPGGTDTIIIVYNYLLQTWSTHTYIYANAEGGVADVCVSYPSSVQPSQYTVLTANGSLFQEQLATSATAFLDQDSDGGFHFFSTEVTLPWVRIPGSSSQSRGIQSYQRARRIQFYGQQMAPCGFQFQTAINYSPTIVDTSSWTDEELSASDIPGQIEEHVAGANQKQMAIQMTFSDLAPSSLDLNNGQGMRFISAAFELENIGTRYRQIGISGRR